MSRFLRLSFLIPLVFLLLPSVSAHPPASASSDADASADEFQAATPTPEPLTPAQLIALINRGRTGRGLPALIVDPILMGTAQSTADIMAAYAMTSHIGDVRGRVIAAGYGAGDIPWATENFAVLPAGEDASAAARTLLTIWSDELHLKPMADPNYKHIGAGVAAAGDNAVYYIVHAAYTSNRIYKPGSTPAPGAPAAFSISQYVFAVQTATPGADGSLTHVVRQGQSLWSIAIAYQTHIDVLQRMNGMGRDNLTIYTGQKLRVPTVEKPVPIRTVAAETSTAAAAISAGPAVYTTAAAAVAVAGPAAQAAAAAGGTPVLTPPVPAAGDSLDQTILTVLAALGLVGVASILSGILFHRGTRSAV